MIRKFLFGAKKPKCLDIHYVNEVFQFGLNQSSLSDVNSSFDDAHKQISSKDELIKLISLFSRIIEINIEFTFIGETEEMIYGLPKIYEWSTYELPVENSEKKLIYEIQLTDFALANLDVSLCELILLLVDFKLIETNAFIPDEISCDIEQYRGFISIIACSFGFGEYLLSRYEVFGLYKDKNNVIYTVKYPVPVNLYFLIFACSLYSHKSRTELKSLKWLTTEIQKEYLVCMRFIEDGG